MSYQNTFYSCTRIKTPKMDMLKCLICSISVTKLLLFYGADQVLKYKKHHKSLFITHNAHLSLQYTRCGECCEDCCGEPPPTMLLYLRQLLLPLWRMSHTPLIGVVTHATPSKAFFLINERFVECAGITFSRFAKVKYGIVGIILVQYAVKQGINRTKMLPL